MHDQKRARIKRLSIWFTLNLIIFIVCYLNYLLQLKHRYLYKTLNVGLCFSRAAAMVINFNLLLVWLPMCKYTLTRLACIANGASALQRQKLQDMISSAENIGQQPNAINVLAVVNHHLPNHQITFSSKFSFKRLTLKLKWSANKAVWRIRYWLCVAKLNYIDSFLIAVDHCTSLHTICATTITLASIIHTIAHLMNVINFSKKFDPFLSNLNMAEYKGQNPFYLLLSVPGITGCFMMIILLLMSLSSIDIIRNSSFDLFQIFHRLSVVFVILLILHPSSHVLKEQSNVDRHHPDICYNRMILLERKPNSNTSIVGNATLITAEATILMQKFDAQEAPPGDRLNLAPKILIHEQIRSFSSTPNERQTKIIEYQGQHINSSTTRPQEQIRRHVNNDNDYDNSKNKNNETPKIDLSSRRPTANITEELAVPRTKVNKTIELRHANDEKRLESVIVKSRNNRNNLFNYVSPIRNDKSNATRTTTPIDDNLDRFCLDSRPLFVSQSSICWYVLSIGLSCYLLDMLLRRLRRSKNTIQLLDALSDREGNLLELILSNNHRRFAHWLPGQFVYLNCPQIAAYEWHPFTISSMDNKARQFTLHIKTGGDWTRKLRHELELRLQQQHSVSLFTQIYQGYDRKNDSENTVESNLTTEARMMIGCGHRSRLLPRTGNMIHCQVASLDCYDERTGRLQIECKKMMRISQENHDDQQQQPKQLVDESDHSIKIDLDNIREEAQLYSVCSFRSLKNITSFKHHRPQEQQLQNNTLELYIDGPFHSPFERILEQQVSVCIANGVGWTAFSSVFQRITDNLDNNPKDWWARWRGYAFSSSNLAKSHAKAIQQTGEGNEKAIASTSEVKARHLSDTRLHLMVIVTTVEQLKPFYNIALRYFDCMKKECQINNMDDGLNPIREVRAYITRSTENDADVMEFCRRENLKIPDCKCKVLKVNRIFSIHFGKPDFDAYLSAFSTSYSDKRKISVYCCGSYQVKRVVEEICRNLNGTSKRKGGTNGTLDKHSSGPVYSYHEENF